MSRASDFTPHRKTARQAVSVGVRTVEMGSIRCTPAVQDAARRNLAAFALDQDDPEAWLRDILAVLGLAERLTSATDAD